MRKESIIKKEFPKASIISIKEFKKGCINKTYNIKITPSKEFVLRIYPKDFWKARKEYFLYNLIKNKDSIPVPKVHGLGKDYLILSKIKGKHITKNKKLIKKAGEYLAKLHKIKFNSFGWIIGNKIEPRFHSWERFLEYDLEHKLNKLTKFADKGLIKKSREYFNKNKFLLKIKAEPCLLHKD